jgi:hypothetical protein
MNQFNAFTLLAITTITPLLIYVQSDEIRICKGQEIPSNYVIVAEASSLACPNHDQRSAWVIRKPGSEEAICKVSPMPSGYVIVAETSRMVCPNPDRMNAWRIRKVDRHEYRKSSIDGNSMHDDGRVVISEEPSGGPRRSKPGGGENPFLAIELCKNFIDNGDDKV